MGCSQSNNQVVESNESNQTNSAPKQDLKPIPKPEPKNETPQQRFIREALDAHNRYRRKHGVPELRHDPELSKVAQKYAEYLAKNNLFDHSDCNFNGKRMGENLAMIMDSRLTNYPGDKATEQWYEEIHDHDFNKDWQPSSGHFTQVVWKSTTDVGFGVAKSADGKFYSVGNYYPAGNFMGQFKENVTRPN